MGMLLVIVASAPGALRCTSGRLFPDCPPGPSLSRFLGKIRRLTILDPLDVANLTADVR